MRFDLLVCSLCSAQLFSYLILFFFFVSSLVCVQLLLRKVVVMSTENSLVEIPRGEWTKLRDLYVARDTDPQGYPCINNFIKWVEIDPQLKVNFLSLNGDWQSDGTFVLTVSYAMWNAKVRWLNVV